MYYSHDIIDQVIQANDIVEIIGEYVKLTKKGSTYFGLCPFHNEKTPSFSVSNNAEKQIFYCFGCHAGGSVLTFLMKYENYTFVEALNVLAKRAGILLPEADYKMSEEASLKAAQKEKVLAANKDAAVYFYGLLKSEHGKAALNYLKKRGLSNETIKSFGLGYSDKYWDDLYKYLKAKGYEDEILKLSGLVSLKETEVHDIFWNRVMFPIMDVRNRVIGFGGRVLGDGEPKYVNTQETICFDKSRNLYGLNYAKKYKGKAFILCEGYMDVITLHQAGFSNAVASLGTSLTDGHCMLIKRYTDNVYISYDSDSAGRNAALRALQKLKSAGLSVKIIALSPYKDPDELIKAEGAKGYERKMLNAQSGFLFEINMLSEAYNLDDIDEKVKFYYEAARLLSFIDDEFERESYLKAVSKAYAIDFEMLKSKSVQMSLTRDKTEYTGFRQNIRQKKQNNGGVTDKCRQIILTYLIQNPGFYIKVKALLTMDCFPNEPYNTVALHLFEQLKKNRVNIASLINIFESEEEQETVAEKLNYDFGNMKEADIIKAVEDSIKRIKKEAIDMDLQDETNADKIISLFREKEDLNKLNLLEEN